MDWPTVILTLGALLIIFGAIVAVRIAEAGREAVRDFAQSSIPIPPSPLWMKYESRVEESAEKARERHEEEAERMKRDFEERVAAMHERHAAWMSGKDHA